MKQILSYNQHDVDKLQLLFGKVDTVLLLFSYKTYPTLKNRHSLDYFSLLSC